MEEQTNQSVRVQTEFEEWDTLREDYSISKLRGNEVGHYNTAV